MIHRPSAYFPCLIAITCFSEASLISTLLENVYTLCPAQGLSVTCAVSLGGGVPPACGQSYLHLWEGLFNLSPFGIYKLSLFPQ